MSLFVRSLFLILYQSVLLVLMDLIFNLFYSKVLLKFTTETGLWLNVVILFCFYINFCAKFVMITNGATDITSQPSRIDEKEQLPMSAADTSGAVRLVTSCCVARPLDGGTTTQKQQLVKTG